MNRIYPQMWLDLSREVRDHFVKVFGIVKTGIAEIRDQTLISDGVTGEDLQVITEAKMAEYVGSVAPFHRLWEISISKAKYEINPPIAVEKENIIAEPKSDESKPDLSKPTLIVMDSTGKEILNVPSDMTVTIEKAKFCDLCESGGVRHKANCTKPGIINGYEPKKK